VRQECGLFLLSAATAMLLITEYAIFYQACSAAKPPTIKNNCEPAYRSEMLPPISMVIPSAANLVEKSGIVTTVRREISICGKD
jgi:hypothetical protein